MAVEELNHVLDSQAATDDLFEELGFFTKDTEPQQVEEVKPIKVEPNVSNNQLFDVFQELEIHTGKINELFSTAIKDSVTSKEVEIMELKEKLNLKDYHLKDLKSKIKDLEYDAILTSETILKLQHETQLLKVEKEQNNEYKNLIEKFKLLRLDLMNEIKQKDVRIKELEEMISSSESDFESVIVSESEYVQAEAVHDMTDSEQVDYINEPSGIYELLETNEVEDKSRFQGEDAERRELIKSISNEVAVPSILQASTTEVSEVMDDNKVENSNIETINPLEEDEQNKFLFSTRKSNMNNDTKIKLRFKTLFE